MTARVFCVLVLLAFSAATASSQNCNGTSVGFVPLNDLGPGAYQGFQGGLYPGGSNTMPAAHAAGGAASAAGVVPRLANGTIAPTDPNARIVLLSIGMSNTTQEFSTFLPASNADTHRNSRLVVVDGAQGGQDAVTIANPNANYWAVIQTRLAAAGVTASQVEVCWLKEAEAGIALAFPNDALTLQADLKTICQNLKIKFPNVRICYLSSRIYAGYAISTLSPEPYAYQGGFAAKWLIEAQINGDPGLNYNPANGAVTSPWLAWGPYLWADGLNPRSDGLTWACNDYQSDGTHPNVLARFKVSAMLEHHFKTDPTAVPWYVATAAHPVRAAVFAYGTPCPGTPGLPNLVVSGVPAIGASFSIGVSSARPNAPAAVFVSLNYADMIIAGACHDYIDPAQLVLPDAVTLTSFTTNAAGSGGWIASVPNDPSLMGLSAFAQVLISDPAGAAFPNLGGAAVTSAARLFVGTP
jgi:hypothetical protein